MSRNRGADCCEYQEAKRRSARKKLQKKKKEIRVSSKHRMDDCDEYSDDEISEKHESGEKQSQTLKNFVKLISWKEEMIGRIKPSIEDRDKYSMDSRHIRCFLEPAEIEKLELEEKLFEVRKREPCVSDIGRKNAAGARKWRTKRTEKEEKKNNAEESGNVDDNHGANDESGPEIDEQTERNRLEGRKQKRNKGEFWCPEIKKKVDAQLRDGRESEMDCKDSICSFDSQIDLSGLALTEEDMKKIDEARRSRVTSSPVESKETTE